MSVYDHHTMMQLRLGRWGDDPHPAPNPGIPRRKSRARARGVVARIRRVFSSIAP
ncbi:hypothetical protein [Roseobacter sp.]|uniref:hypothetical protein n=1 Tax=Roseobacter sp. TaxID=1907202 RepID=UPI003296EF73